MINFIGRKNTICDPKLIIIKCIKQLFSSICYAPTDAHNVINYYNFQLNLHISTLIDVCSIWTHPTITMKELKNWAVDAYEKKKILKA